MEINYIIREAKTRDSRFIFDLSNEKIVRDNSIKKRKIDWEEHIKWFNKKLNDNNYEFFVIYDEHNNFIGQIRYEISDDKAVVSISITKNFREEKLASKILADSAAILFRNKEKIERVFAYIRKENIASLRAFEKAGYIFEKSLNINNENYKLYILSKD